MELEKISKKPLVFEEPVFQNTETVFSPAQQKAVDILKNAVGSKLCLWQTVLLKKPVHQKKFWKIRNRKS